MIAPQYNPQQVRFVQNAQVESSESIEQFRVCYMKQVGGGFTDPPTITTATTLKNVSHSKSQEEIFNDSESIVKDGYGVTQTSLLADDAPNASEQNAADKNRMVPVATSGLLLVEMNTVDDDSELVIGDTLSVDNQGRASKSGSADKDTSHSAKEKLRSAPVSFCGVSPVVKEVVSMGDKKYVLVDFI